MRIAIDFSSARVGAGAVYARSMLASLARLDNTNEYLVLLAGRKGISVPQQHNFCGICWPPRTAAARLPLFQAVLPWWLKQRRVDVLVSPFEYSILAAPCPIVLGMQNLNPYGGPRPSTRAGWLRNRMIRHLAWLSVRRAARIFFLSDASRHIICRQLGIGPEKTQVIPCGLDAGALFAGRNGETDPGVLVKSAPPGPYILSVSAVSAHKDFESLLRAFADLVRRRNLSHRVVIAGPLSDKPYLERLQSLIAELRLHEKVVFLGEVPHGCVGQLYRNADAVVLPSRAETFGMPILEAMACGAPVVASDLPALREVGAEASIFYSPGDAMDLSAQLERILTDRKLRLSLLEAGRKRAAQFSWDVAAKRLLTLVQDATNPSQ